MNHSHDSTNVGVSQSDCIYWLHECFGYLFQSRVKLTSDSTIKPEMDGDPIDYLNRIENLSSIEGSGSESLHKLLIQESGQEPVEIDLDSETNIQEIIKSSDINFLRTLFYNLENKQWSDIDVEDIESSQDIIYNMLLSFESIN